MGRRSDPVNRCFEVKRTFTGASQCFCRGCGFQVSHVVTRMRTHANDCAALRSQHLWEPTGKTAPGSSQLLANYVRPAAGLVHRALARLVYANNLPFTFVESSMLRELLQRLAPNPPPLCAKSVGEPLLDAEYGDCRQALAS